MSSFAVFMGSFRVAALVAVSDEVLLGEGEFFRRVLAALGVFAEDVGLDVEGGAGDEGAEAGGSVGVGDDGDLDDVVGDGRYGEADAFDGDGALRDYVASEGFGKLDAETPVS